MNDSNLRKFDEIDLKELLEVLLASKKLIILTTSVFALVAIIYSLMLPNQYRSESILIAAESQDHGSFSQLSGLAALAGVGLSGSGTDGVTETMEIIKSREFVRHLVKFDDVLPSIMAANSYDKNTGKLIFDPEKFDVKTNAWVDSKKPSYLQTYKSYTNKLSISQDDFTGLVTVSFEHISPVFAKDFLSLIIKESNDIKRKKDIATSVEAIDYLKSELSQTSLIEIKDSINQLIKAKLETKMMANIYEEYSLVTIEPPFVPEDKSQPRRSLIVIIFTLLGGMISLFIVSFRHYFLQEKKSIESNN